MRTTDGRLIFICDGLEVTFCPKCGLEETTGLDFCTCSADMKLQGMRDAPLRREEQARQLAQARKREESLVAASWENSPDE
jgi:hypothetical protein